MIDFEAQEGYELPSTFPDGIKVNGKAPDEVFAVYGGKWNHCVAKIKATKTETTETGIDENTNSLISTSEYVDGTETTEYTSKSGSTIITLNKDFVNSLSVGEHTLKVAFNNGGEATTKFTIVKAESTSNSPKAGDNISVWISLVAISMLGIVGIIRYTKKIIN
ncbi:MAG: hypothetical protein IKE01_02400 [Clostridia bacterium]|nr:hypothetical protein [Clostridia bacterium]